MDLLKKSNINLPNFELPKILSKNPNVLKENFACDFQFKSLKRKGTHPVKPVLVQKTSNSSIVSNDQVTTIPTGVLVPVKVITFPQPTQDLNKKTRRRRKISQASDHSCQYVKLFCRRDDGKLPIPTLKRRPIVKKKFKRRRRPRKDVNLPPSIRIESPTANFLMNFPVVKSGGKHDSVDELHDFLLPPTSYKEVAPDSFTNNSVIPEVKPQIARNLFNVPKQEQQTSASFNCVIVPAESSLSHTSSGRVAETTSTFSYMPLGKPQTSIPLPSFNSTTQGIYALGDEKTSTSILVSSDKPIVFAEPNNVLVISSKPSQKEKPNKSSAKYYFEEPATNFTFNLTNTTNTQSKDTTATSSYYHKPWIPPSLYSNSSQPAAFTFSLTPTTNSVVTSQPSTTINFTFSLTNTTTTKEVNSNKKVFYDCEKQQKSHVNWMTTSDTSYAQDYSNILPNPSTNSVEENYFYTWSPIKGERSQANDFWSTNDVKPSPIKKHSKPASSSSVR